MHRNFGLGHLHPKALRERLQHGFSKRAAEPAPVVRIRVEYLGRDLFVFKHDGNDYTPTSDVCSRVGGKS